MHLLLSAILIFSLRLVDVTLGTMRIVLLTRGSGWRSGIVGFLESLTWVVAASQVLRNLDDPVRMVAFAAGFGAGTALGVVIERWIAMGTMIVRIVAPVASPQVTEVLRDAGFGVTVLNGEGLQGDVRMAITVVARRRLREVLTIVHRVNPTAFVTYDKVDKPTPSYRRAVAVRK